MKYNHFSIAKRVTACSKLDPEVISHLESVTQDGPPNSPGRWQRDSKSESVTTALIHPHDAINNEGLWHHVHLLGINNHAS